VIYVLLNSIYVLMPGDLGLP